MKSIHRKRLACAECTRKKIKCDKVIPCRNCTRRSTACYRLPATPVSQSPTYHTPSDDLLEGNTSHCVENPHSTKQSDKSLSNSAASVTSSQNRCESDSTAPSLPVFPALASDSSTDSAEVENAATILEFLAWGRRKVQTYGYSESSSGQSPGDVAFEDGLHYGERSHFRLSDDSPLAILQLLLPEPRTVQRIIRYHCDCLLWYHASFHPLVFQDETDNFLHLHNSRLDRPGVNLQWAALLFAVLAGSMTCAPAAVAHSWGFKDQERCSIARRWFKAALVCLNRADYTSHHSVYAVQCITTMTISAHMLGHSNSHSVMLATAVRIAQSLGLHMLGSSAGDTADTIVRKEVGRRVWTELCIQDWFSIAFSESYLIHLLAFNTHQPINCKDEDMATLPDDIPTSIGYHRLLYEVARLMPRLQDELVQSNTLYTKYEHVLRYDTQMRTLANKQVPLWLREIPIDASWPCYVPWARHCLAISSAHKIIMIHRKFLWPSFTNPAFSFTRKTCIAASKTIIRECRKVAAEDGPVLWIYHAFCVAAGIILCLDMLFRSPTDSEHLGHWELVHDTLAILSRSETSMIAKRGVKILSHLCHVEKNRRSSHRQQVVTRDMSTAEQHRHALDVRKLVQAVCEEKAGVDSHLEAPYLTVQATESPAGLQEDSQSPYDPLGNVLGPQSRFDMHDPFEDILFMSQYR